MSLTFLSLLAVVILTGLAMLTNIITQKLGSLRNPIHIWDTLHDIDVLPSRLRGWIFSTIVGFANPYCRSINFRITELRKGKACGVMKYVKVSRGLLTASSVVDLIKDREAKEITTHVLIKNTSFETVSQLTLTWQLDLKDTK
ncbi:hypothetical protein BGZ49_008565 [Haplosporangium sp. Z 27]|nr:hypothetical protein BGZ49_008565 [Haplosporangium sp. Z 27]